MAKDHYAVLGVSRHADAKEIKAAYRRLARKNHPDVNPNDKAAEARFKEISSAYEIVGDPEKRKLYDSYGDNWEAVQQHGGVDFGSANFDFGAGGAGFETIYEQFFGGHGRRAETSPTVVPRDIEKVVELTLEEIDSGAKRSITYQSADACKACDGKGTVSLRMSKLCPNCSGTGRSRGLLGMNQICPVCSGSGQSTLESCPTCKGAATTPTTKRVEVTIPAGFPEGKKLRVPGRGVVGAGSRAGDLYVVVKEASHATFKRSGDALEVEVDVPFTLAALGGEVKAPTLRGSVTMRIPPGSQSGQKFRLAGQGVSKLNAGRSDLFVRLRVTVPKNPTPRQFELLKQLQETGA